MQELYSPKAYPEAIRKLIQESGQIGIELANRWMLGWPKTVKSLIQSDEYPQAFKYQLGREINSLIFFLKLIFYVINRISYIV